MLNDIVRKNRSYRRFKQDSEIEIESLHALIELARLCPSSRNQQALKFLPIAEGDTCERVFPYLSWAGYLPDWNSPEDGQHPSGYIIILGDSELGSQFEIDTGIVAQTMLLGAVEKGYGGCMIGSIKREGLQDELAIPDRYKIILVIALGVPDESVIIDPIQGNDIKYWRDDQHNHHVPKRTLHEIIWP